MPDAKISALTALGAAPATGDLVPLVDISDTTMAASGTTKKVTVDELTDAVNAPVLVVPSGAYQIVPADCPHNCTIQITANYASGVYIRLPATGSSPATGTRYFVIIKSSADGETAWLELQKASGATVTTYIGGLSAGGLGYPVHLRLTYLGSNLWDLEIVVNANATNTLTFTNAD